MIVLDVQLDQVVSLLRVPAVFRVRPVDEMAKHVGESLRPFNETPELIVDFQLARAAPEG